MGWELLDDCPPDELARTAARRALLMLESRPCPAGRMPVVITTEAGGTIFYMRPVGTGWKRTWCRKGLSVYRGKLGRKWLWTVLV